MYVDAMRHRTQVYLDEEEIELLDAAGAQSGAKRSELIRRAVRLQYGQLKPSDRSAALQTSAGAWAGRSYSGTDYVDALRGDADERLALLRKS